MLVQSQYYFDICKNESIEAAFEAVMHDVYGEERRQEELDESRIYSKKVNYKGVVAIRPVTVRDIKNRIGIAMAAGEGEDLSDLLYLDETSSTLRPLLITSGEGSTLGHVMFMLQCEGKYVSSFSILV